MAFNSILRQPKEPRRPLRPRAPERHSLQERTRLKVIYDHPSFSADEVVGKSLFNHITRIFKPSAQTSRLRSKFWSLHSHAPKKYRLRISRQAEKNLAFDSLLTTPGEPIHLPKTPFDDVCEIVQEIGDFHNSWSPAKFRAIGLYRRNAVASPLLRLPRELREKIFGYVLGDKDIHLAPVNRYMHKKPFEAHADFELAHVICPFHNNNDNDDKSGSMMEKKNDSGDDDGGVHPEQQQVAPCVDHSKCQLAYLPTNCQEADGLDGLVHGPSGWILHQGRGRRPDTQLPSPPIALPLTYTNWLRAERLDLSLLRVCSQVSAEARYVMWVTNRWWHEGRQLVTHDYHGKAREEGTKRIVENWWWWSKYPVEMEWRKEEESRLRMVREQRERLERERLAELVDEDDSLFLED
ncbi:MAG: hypothetical protein Q9201_005873 [Fulgogasparrea decipioides]